MQEYKYNFHNKLLILSNINFFDEYFLMNNQDRSDNIKNRLIIGVINEKPFPSPGVHNIRFGRTYYCSTNSIWYEKIFFGQKFKLLLEGLDSEVTKFYITGKHLKLVKFSLPMTDLYNFANYFSAIFMTKLLLQNMAVVHSSIVEVAENEGLLLTAFPDTGKTLTALNLVEKNNAKILSDDLNFVSSNKSAYLSSPPFNVSLNTLSEMDLARKFNMRGLTLRRYINSLIGRLAFVPFLPMALHKFGINVNIKDIIKNRVIDHTKIGKIYFLENSNDERIIEISSDEAQRKLISISERELYFLNSNHMILAYSYISDNLSFRILKEKYYHIIESLCDGLECYIIRAEKPTQFATLIQQL